MTESEVRELIRETCRRAGSQKNWAAQSGFSAAYLCDVLEGRRAPGNAILVPLGLRRVVSYEPVPTITPDGKGNG